jgi:hypothetical protein
MPTQISNMWGYTVISYSTDVDTSAETRSRHTKELSTVFKHQSRSGHSQSVSREGLLNEKAQHS